MSKKKNMKKNIFSKSLIVSFGAILLVGCANSNEKTASVESVAMICGIGSTSYIDRYAGVIESQSDTKVQKDDNKTVAEVLVSEGDAVESGQVLFRYDKAQLELNFEKLKIEIEQLKSAVNSKQAEISTLEKERDMAAEDAKDSYTLQIQELNADITESNFNIQSKEREIEQINSSLGSLEIKSPVSGVIKSVGASNSQEKTSEDAFIIIRQTGDFRVKGYVNETNRESLYEGMDVLVRARVGDVVQRGTIKVIDLKNPVSASSDYYFSEDDTSKSGKYPFYAELEESEGLIIGQHVYIEPDYGQMQEDDGQINLPAYYINDKESSAWVWAKDSKERLEKRSVTLGDYDAEMDVYIVKDGLSADDFIAYPDENLKTGMRCVEFDFAGDDDIYDDMHYDMDNVQDMDIEEEPFLNEEYNDNNEFNNEAPFINNAPGGMQFAPSNNDAENAIDAGK